MLKHVLLITQFKQTDLHRLVDYHMCTSDRTAWDAIGINGFNRVSLLAFVRGAYSSEGFVCRYSHTQPWLVCSNSSN
jgi:hypothetical protein